MSVANKVNNSAPISSPFNLLSFESIGNYLTQLINSVGSEFRDHALRLNKAVMADGSEVPTAPMMLKPYLKAVLPDVLLYKDGIIIVTDDVGGRVQAFSDGTNWRRVTDRAVIS